MTNKIFNISCKDILSSRYLLHFLMTKKDDLTLYYPRNSEKNFNKAMVLFDDKNQHLYDPSLFTESTLLVYNAPQLASRLEGAKELEIKTLPSTIQGKENDFVNWVVRFGFQAKHVLQFIDPEDLLMESKKMFFTEDKEHFKFFTIKQDPLQPFVNMLLKRNRKAAVALLFEHKEYFSEKIFPILMYLSKSFSSKSSSERETPGWDAGELQTMGKLFSRLDDIYRKINIDYFEHFVSIITLSLDAAHLSLDHHLYLSEPFDLL